MYFGMEPNLNLSAKMVLCEAELKRIRQGKLKGSSFETSKGFKCIHSHHGNKINRGTYRTIEACNTQWDNCEIEREIENLKLRLRARGYQVSNTGKQTKYVVKMPDGYKSFANEEVARLQYETLIKKEVEELEAKLIPIDKADIICK